VKAPRVGIAELAFLLPRLLRDRAGAFLEIAERHGEVVFVPVPGRPFYLVSSPALVQQVLQTRADRYKKSFDIELALELLGDGLVTTEGEQWRKNRSVVAKAFRTLDREEVTTKVRRLVVEWVSGFGRSGARVMANETFTTLIMSILAEAILGVSPPVDPAGLMSATVEGLRFVERRVSAPIDIDRYIRTPWRATFERALGIIDAQIALWVAEARQRAKDGDAAANVGVVHRLVEEADSRGGAESERWLRDEIRTLLMAGHETSAVALTWLVTELASQPDLQHQLAAEEGTTLLGSVIDETLRLHPPVWALGRESIVADELGAFELPAGSTVLVSPFVTQRLPGVWPRASELVPDRFVDGKPPHAYAMFPFSNGPRRCLGDRLAVLEMQIVTQEMLRRFVVRRTDTAPIGREALISLRPARDFEIELTPREGSRDASGSDEPRAPMP
jgi:cytochrome P450